MPHLPFHFSRCSGIFGSINLCQIYTTRGGREPDTSGIVGKWANVRVRPRRTANNPTRCNHGNQLFFAVFQSCYLILTTHKAEGSNCYRSVQFNDSALPVIELISRVFPCIPSTDSPSLTRPSCSIDTWTVRFQVSDVDSGLRDLSVISAAVENASSLTVAPFEEGTQSTVGANYSSTCCYPTATIRAVDGSGQVAYVLIGAVRSGSESVTIEGCSYTCWRYAMMFALLSNFVMI